MARINLKDWVEKVDGLDEAAKKNLVEFISKEPAALKAIEEGVMRQEDYSRLSNERDAALRARETAAAKKESDIDTYVEQLETWRGQNEGVVTTARRELAEERTKRFAQAERVKAMALKYGMSEADVKEALEKDGVTTQAEADKTLKKAAADTVDTSKFLTREDAAGVLGYSSLLAAEMEDVAAEYQDLFGKQLRNRRPLLEEVIVARKKDPQVSLRSFIEQKYDFNAQRKVKADQEFEAKVTERVKEKEIQLRSELAANGDLRSQNDRPRDTSPLLDRARKGEFKVDESKGIASQGNESRGWQKAVEKWNEGTYRQDSPAASAAA